MRSKTGVRRHQNHALPSDGERNLVNPKRRLREEQF
jgi:hypothetical protein